MITKGKVNLLKIIISITFISIVVFFQLKIKQLNINAENCTEGKLELSGRYMIFHYSVDGINYQLKKKLLKKMHVIFYQKWVFVQTNMLIEK